MLDEEGGEDWGMRRTCGLPACELFVLFIEGFLARASNRISTRENCQIDKMRLPGREEAWIFGDELLGTQVEVLEAPTGTRLLGGWRMI